MIDSAQISLDGLIQSVRHPASNVIDIVRTYSMSINTGCVANTIAAAAGRQHCLHQSWSLLCARIWFGVLFSFLVCVRVLINAN